jgi:hypothetical protein
MEQFELDWLRDLEAMASVGERLSDDDYHRLIYLRRLHPETHHPRLTNVRLRMREQRNNAS